MRTCILALIWAATAFCQAALNEPYFLIRIIRTGPEPGAASVRPYRDAGANIDVIGMRSITGSAQNWLIENHRSFGSLEAIESALAEDPLMHTDGSNPDLYATRWLGMCRMNLSYRPQEAIKLFPNARYFQVSVFTIRPGSEFDFAELVRLRRAAFDSINLDRPEIAYQIISGASSGTYVFLAPLQSLSTLDQGLARVPVYAEGLAHAGAKARKDIAQDGDVTREHFIFRIEPSRSYVTDGFAAGAPEFWRNK